MIIYKIRQLDKFSDMTDFLDKLTTDEQRDLCDWIEHLQLKAVEDVLPNNLVKAYERGFNDACDEMTMSTPSCPSESSIEVLIGDLI